MTAGACVSCVTGTYQTGSGQSLIYIYIYIYIYMRNRGFRETCGSDLSHFPSRWRETESNGDGEVTYGGDICHEQRAADAFIVLMQAPHHARPAPPEPTPPLQVQAYSARPANCLDSLRSRGVCALWHQPAATSSLLLSDRRAITSRRSRERFSLSHREHLPSRDTKRLFHHVTRRISSVM